MRSQAAVGQRFVSGVILAILPPAGKHRGTRVLVRCPCNEIFEARYSTVRSGERKSCRHLRNENWKWKREEILEGMSPHRRLQLFDLAQLHGRHEAARRSGEYRHVVGIAWLDECRRLASLPQVLQREIFSAAQEKVEGAMDLFNLTRGEVLRICYVWNRDRQAGAPPASDLAAARARLAEAVGLGLALDPGSREFDKLLLSMQKHIENAMSRIRLSSAKRGTYPREFSQAELGSVSASRYGWVYEVLRATPEDVIQACFKDNGVRFAHACEYTLSSRKERSDAFRLALREAADGPGPEPVLLDDNDSDQACSPSSRSSGLAGSRLGDGHRFTRPDYAPSVIALTLLYCVRLWSLENGS